MELGQNKMALLLIFFISVIIPVHASCTLSIGVTWGYTVGLWVGALKKLLNAKEQTLSQFDLSRVAVVGI